MATETTPNGPRDTHAERATLAAGLWHPPWWSEVREHVQPHHFSYIEHQAIASALDELSEVGPFVPLVVPDYLASDMYWPSSLTVRIHAVATITDLNPGPIAAVCRFADGRHTEAAGVVRAHAVTRDRILALRYEQRDALDQ